MTCFQENEYKIVGLCWSPNNQKLAVATSDRQVFLFDDKGERRDRFSTKPIDPEAGKKSYVITGIAYSPDSTKIAVAQSDCIVYVYRIGEKWGDKKVRYQSNIELSWIGKHELKVQCSNLPFPPVLYETLYIFK